MHTIDRERSAARIGRDVETLAGAAYTLSADAICRYAYTDVYASTLAYFRQALEALGFDVGFDPVGTSRATALPASPSSASARTATRTATAASGTARSAS
jgi:hypothetical protein